MSGENRSMGGDYMKLPFRLVWAERDLGLWEKLRFRGEFLKK